MSTGGWVQNEHNVPEPTDAAGSFGLWFGEWENGGTVAAGRKGEMAWRWRAQEPKQLTGLALEDFLLLSVAQGVIPKNCKGAAGPFPDRSGSVR